MSLTFCDEYPPSGRKKDGRMLEHPASEKEEIIRLFHHTKFWKIKKVTTNNICILRR